MSNKQNQSARCTMTLRSQKRIEILRNGLTRTQTLQENINTGTIRILDQVMEEADNINSETTLNEKINHQGELLLDSEVMNASSKVLKCCSKSLKVNLSEYNYRDFAKKLIHYTQQTPDTSIDEPNWIVLEREITKYFKKTPNYTTLLGTLTPLEIKEVPKRKPTVRDAQAVIKRPENVVAVDKEEESVEQTVQKIKKFIFNYYKKHRKPLDFFRLILHPTDFGKTVENTLHVAFLVKDGTIKLMKDESGIIVIKPCNKEMSEHARKKGTNVQNVMALNIEQWKTLNDIYRLPKPMIDFATDT